MFGISKSRCFAALLCLTFIPVAAAKDGEFPRDWFWHDDDEKWEKHQAMIGKDAPKLDLSGWVNGEVTQDDMEGKIVVVDFWATWCGPCIAAIPKNNELAEKYKDDVIILGVCTSQGQEKMDEVAESKNIEYPTAKDPNSTSAKAWNVMWYPTYAVVDREGKLRAIGLRPDAVEKVIKKLKDEEKTASAE